MKISLCVLTVLALTACQSISDKRKIDYKSAHTLPPLDVPPDLAAIPETNLPPGASSPSATYSTFVNQGKAEVPGATQPAGTANVNQTVLPQMPDMHIERDSQARWLVVQAPPERLWTQVREFVSSLGFVIDRENQTTGVIETDWAENRAKVGDAMQNWLSRTLGSIYSSGIRDKFRFRLERGAQPGTTEIYLTHQGMEENVYEVAGGASGPTIRWQPRPSDPSLEAEMLQQLIVYLGKSEDQAKAVVAQAPAAPAAERARLTRRGEQVLLSLEESLDRAWRRVGLSLDRIGFTVEDRDRSKGIYYVRYIDPEVQSEKPGLLTRWFGGDAKQLPSEQYQIQLEAAGPGTDVAVRNKDGALESGKTSERILSLLYEQLK